jgi:hypothetical protein
MMGKAGPRHKRHVITASFDGQQLLGAYEVLPNSVLVTTRGEQIREVLDGRDPDSVAREVLQRILKQRFPI